MVCNFDRLKPSWLFCYGVVATPPPSPPRPRLAQLEMYTGLLWGQAANLLKRSAHIGSISVVVSMEKLADVKQVCLADFKYMMSRSHDRSMVLHKSLEPLLVARCGRLLLLLGSKQESIQVSTKATV